MIQYISDLYGLSSIKDNSAILYEDNIVYVVEIRERYIKGDRI